MPDFKGKLKRLLPAAGYAVLIFAAAMSLASCNQGPKTGMPDAASLMGGESRATLAPERYTGETARAYAAAREIPEIIDSLYCYCDCEKHFGHKSLLTCFVDEHAAHCDICIDEALMARDMHGKGMDVFAIRKAVDEKYSRKGHDH